MILSRSSISRLKLVRSMHSSFSLLESDGLTFSKNRFLFGSSFDPNFADPEPPDRGDCPLGDRGDLSWCSAGGVRGFGDRGNHGCVSSTPSSFIDNFVKLFRRFTLSFAWLAAKSPKNNDEKMTPKKWCWWRPNASTGCWCTTFHQHLELVTQIKDLRYHWYRVCH